MSAIVVARRLLKETTTLALVAVTAFVIAHLASASQREHGINFRLERFETLSLVLPEQEIGCLKRVKWLRPGELPALWVQATLYGVP